MELLAVCKLKSVFIFSLLFVLLQSVAFAQAPDVLFVVERDSNGGGTEAHSPLTSSLGGSWNDTDTHGAAVANSWSGGGSGGTLSLGSTSSVNGTAGSNAISTTFTVSTYVRGTPSVTYATNISGNVSASTNGIYNVSAAAGPASVLVTSSTSPGSDNDSTSSSNFTNINCNGSNSDGCTQFSAYPGVTYCAPPGATGVMVGSIADTDNVAPRTSNVSATLTQVFRQRLAQAFRHPSLMDRMLAVKLLT